MIAACQERLRAEILVSGIIGDDGDASPAPIPW